MSWNRAECSYHLASLSCLHAVILLQINLNCPVNYVSWVHALWELVENLICFIPPLFTEMSWSNGQRTLRSQLLRDLIVNVVIDYFSNDSTVSHPWVKYKKGTYLSFTIDRIFTTSWSKGTPRILEWVAYPFSSRSSWPTNRTGVSCIAGRFSTNGAIREAESSLQFLISEMRIVGPSSSTYLISDLRTLLIIVTDK